MKKCPECNKSLADNAKICPKCGYIFHSVHNTAVSFLIAAFGFFFLMIILSVFFSSCEKNTPDIPTTQDACYMSHQFLDKLLKAPSTAQYESCYDAKVTQIGNNQFVVNSYVDSQNSFGAMIRTKYSMTLKYLGNDNWERIDYNIYD